MQFLKLRNTADVEFYVNLESICSFALMTAKNHDGTDDYEGRAFMNAAGQNYILDRISSAEVQKYVDQYTAALLTD